MYTRAHIKSVSGKLPPLFVIVIKVKCLLLLHSETPNVTEGVLVCHSSSRL